MNIEICGQITKTPDSPDYSLLSPQSFVRIE